VDLKECGVWAPGADQSSTAVSAIEIVVNKKLGGKYQGLIIILCTEIFTTMSHGLLKMN
jgi:hypothetical protein